MKYPRNCAETPLVWIPPAAQAEAAFSELTGVKLIFTNCYKPYTLYVLKSSLSLIEI